MTDSVYTGEDFEDKVRKQVEFYFLDLNLQLDRFLFRIYEANDGWVQLQTILTFGRMKQYRPEERVIKALKESSELVLLANEDMVGRKAPLKDLSELKNNKKRNSVHIEGFPAEATQDDLEEWFALKIVPLLPKEKGVASIRRIKTRSNKEFTGAVDVEFKSQEDADFFLEKLTVAYPDGAVDEKEEKALKKMSLLTFRAMKESSKRFGQNEVEKRHNKSRDGPRKRQRRDSKAKDAAVSETDKPESSEKSPVPEKADESERTETAEKPESTETVSEGKPETLE